MESLKGNLVLIDDDDLGHFTMTLGLGDCFLFRIINFEGLVFESDAIFS